MRSHRDFSYNATSFYFTPRYSFDTPKTTLYKFIFIANLITQQN